MEWVDRFQLLWLKTFMVRHGGSSASSYLADPTSPIPSHCAVIILFKSESLRVPVIPESLLVYLCLVSSPLHHVEHWMT